MTICIRSPRAAGAGFGRAAAGPARSERFGFAIGGGELKSRPDAPASRDGVVDPANGGC
jgi:hypothetical protein